MNVYSKAEERWEKERKTMQNLNPNEYKQIQLKPQYLRDEHRFE